ncbi:MAG: hypothetical protein NTZ33_06895 [Bacteroidetes bacterium]|nr:hypothetical protein [Bacteroidota bacterium]
MKYLLYIIAGLLIIIWVNLFKPYEIVHLILAFAIAIILFTLIFEKRLSGKSNKFKDKKRYSPSKYY